MKTEFYMLITVWAYRLAVRFMNAGDRQRVKGRKRLAKWLHARGYTFISVCMRAQRKAYSRIDPKKKALDE